LEIIPVIDLQSGQVVHAKGGVRAEYRPVESQLTTDSSPLSVVQALLDHYSFQRLYIADLDAIIKIGNQFREIQLISKTFPDLELWVDIGIQGRASLDDFYQHITGRPVIGSETLTEAEIFKNNLKKPPALQAILSLDFSADGFLGPSELENNSQLWPQDIIVMSLDYIGKNTGPDINRLIDIGKREHHSIYAAGGVRNNRDLKVLAAKGISGALVASGLHNRQIKPV